MLTSTSSESPAPVDPQVNSRPPIPKGWIVPDEDDPNWIDIVGLLEKVYHLKPKLLIASDDSDFLYLFQSPAADGSPRYYYWSGLGQTVIRILEPTVLREIYEALDRKERLETEDVDVEEDNYTW